MMRYKVNFLICFLVYTFCQPLYANSTNVTNIIELMDGAEDRELIDFGCTKNKKFDCWLLVKTAEIGQLKFSFQINLLKIGADNKILQSIQLTQDEYIKRAVVTNFQVVADYVYTTLVLNSNKILILRVKKQNGEVEVIGERDLNSEEQSFDFAVLSNNQKLIFVVSRRPDAWPQIYATSLDDHLIWKNPLDITGLKVSAVRDVREIGSSLVVSGTGRSKDMDKGWVAILNDKGKLVEIFMEDDQLLKLFSSSSTSELGVVSMTKSEDEKFGLLSDLVVKNDFSNLVPMKNGNRRNSVYHHMCGNQILAAVNIKDETGVQFYLNHLQIENGQAIETMLQTYNKNSSFYRNYIFYNWDENIFIGSTLIKIMADRKLRVGVKIDLIQDEQICSDQSTTKSAKVYN